MLSRLKWLPGPAAGRRLHKTHVRHRSAISGPYLLDECRPRYQLLTSVQEAQKRSRAYAHLRECNLCPRLCGVNRFERAGTCLIGSNLVVNTIAPHFAEEPCITGRNGSGAVFFSGCNLRCVFCQNHDIAHQKNGFDLTPEQLGEWMVKLQEVGGVTNVNLVTPEHVVPQVALAILHAKSLGLTVPIVYNTSSYDSLDSLKLMDGLVDIYLADFKVWTAETARRLLKAPDGNYAATAMESIKAMHAQVGDLSFTADGVAKKGLLVRHLVMPGLEEEGKHIVQWLADNVSKDVYLHIMEQWHPRAHVGKGRRRTRRSETDTAARAGQPDGQDEIRKEVRYSDLNRAVTLSEVDIVRAAAEEAGIWRFNDISEHAGFA